MTFAVLLAAGALAAAPGDAGSTQSTGDDGGLSTLGDDAGDAAPATGDASQTGSGGDSGSSAVSEAGSDAGAGDGAAPCTATAYDAATEASVFNYTGVWSTAAPALDDGGVFSTCSNVFSLLGVTDPNVPGFSYTTVASPYPDMAGCHAYDAQGHKGPHDCLCDNCFTLQQQCDALQGCKAIQKCGEDSGCTDPNSCYLIPGAPCTTIIDQWGNGSVSTALVQLIETCGQAHKCPTQ